METDNLEQEIDDIMNRPLALSLPSADQDFDHAIGNYCHGVFFLCVGRAVGSIEY